MKRFYYLLLAGLAMVMVGCSDDDSDKKTPEPKPEPGTVAVTGISVTPSTLNLTEGQTETLTVEVLPADATDKSYTWSMNSDGIVVVSDNSVTALAAGEVILTATTTDGSHTATCTVTVAAAPQEYDITLEASESYLDYYGTSYSNNGEENYWLILSDLGFDNEGYGYDNGHYYTFDLYSDVTPSDLSNLKVPEGTYTLGLEGETAVGTFTPDYSEYRDSSVSGPYEATFTEGEITISYSGDNMVAEAVLVDNLGQVHHVTYEGPCNTADPVEYTVIEMNSLAKGQMINYGAAYGDKSFDYNNWTIYLADATVDLDTLGGEGDILQLEINTEGSATTEITPGPYEMAMTLEPFTSIPGFVQEGYCFGTWYINGGSPYNPASSGSATISKEGDVYTIDFEFNDDASHVTYKGSFTGTLELFDYSEFSASIFKAGTIDHKGNKKLVKKSAFSLHKMMRK